MLKVYLGIAINFNNPPSTNRNILTISTSSAVAVLSIRSADGRSKEGIGTVSGEDLLRRRHCWSVKGGGGREPVSLMFREYYEGRTLKMKVIVSS